MGFMTEISFLNDRWHEIKAEIQKDPGKFVAEIQEAMNGKPLYGPEVDGRRDYLGHETPGTIRLAPNATLTMYESHHADDPRLYLAFENMFLSINPYDFTKQYGARLDDPNDHLLEVLERDVARAESMVKEAKAFLKRKRSERDQEAGVGT